MGPPMGKPLNEVAVAGGTSKSTTVKTRWPSLVMVPTVEFSNKSAGLTFTAIPLKLPEMIPVSQLSNASRCLGLLNNPPCAMRSIDQSMGFAQ